MMPAYANRNEFMRRVRLANSHFERVKKSSLRPLIDVLKSATGTAQQVEQELAQIPANKTNKYRNALYYLCGDYAGVDAANLNLGTLGKTNAARFVQTGMPGNFDPNYPASDRVVAGSAFLNQTVEQFILSNAGNTGIVLIHLTGFQPPMSDIFNEWKVVDHINSVLRVGRQNNCGLCVLYQNNPPVCVELASEVNQFGGTVLAHVHPQHMGAVDAGFLGFAQNHQNLVVMGFDASVCVRANLFGSPEKMPDNSYVRPLVTLGNVVTSRAVLVTAGPINPINHKGEYGVLFNT